MDITFLLVRHPQSRPSPIIAELIDRLADLGARVHRRYPDELVAGADPPPTDLVVLKAKTPAALALAARYHEAGVATVNPYPVTALCRDKIATSDVLAAAGVPVPPTYVETDPRAFASLLSRGPLILKPYRGSQGAGIEIIDDAAQLAHIDHGGDPVLAQAYFPPDGDDQKVYRIGERIFCVERPWPPTPEQKYGRLKHLDPGTLDVVRACGDALGIDLYGVDVIEHEGRPWVVDLSSFPGFKGVPAAAHRLADYIAAYAVTQVSSRRAPRLRERAV